MESKNKLNKNSKKGNRLPSDDEDFTSMSYKRLKKHNIVVEDHK